MIERREQRRKESGLQQALLKAALAALEMTPSGSLWLVVLVFSSLGCFPKLWVATTENLSFRKILVSASGQLQHGIPLRCYLCSSPAEKLCWFGLGFGQQGQTGVKVWPSQGCTDVCTLTRNGVYMPEFIYYLPGTVSYSTVTPVAKSTDRLLLGHYLYHIQMHQS